PSQTAGPPSTCASPNRQSFVGRQCALSCLQHIIAAPRNQTYYARFNKYPVESLRDLDQIRSIPWELPHGLAPPDLARLPSDFQARGALWTDISSPFVCVAGLMSYQYFLELCATELDLIRELTAECHRRIASVLEVLLADRSIECVWMGGCEWLTPPMGSPRLYDELVQPFEADLISRIHDAGALCHVHCHGNVRSTLEAVIRRGADFFEPVEPPPDGDITFAEAKALAAGRITLGGNVEARVLENESVDAVEAATRAAFEGGKERMVLKPSASPIGKIGPSMLANYHRMFDVWEECSPL
ncbi:MAG TPA: uroporphyrinogen decarboxylase family protein, partial [Armatimonadota bacterium]|nr:uroporphyrinogen decarboxylase family protein [Armatimonadota bacterium]